jgi:hypothetical protein
MAMKMSFIIASLPATFFLTSASTASNWALASTIINHPKRFWLSKFSHIGFNKKVYKHAKGI